MVSASKTTSCRALASSKILSISLCTSAAGRQKHSKIHSSTGMKWEEEEENLSLVTTGTWETCTSLSKTLPVALPRLERVLDLSMMALLLGLFSTDLLAKDMSAVTLVMDILKTSPPPKKTDISQDLQGKLAVIHSETDETTHLPSNLCFRKSNSAFCIISVTYKDDESAVINGRNRGHLFLSELEVELVELLQFLTLELNCFLLLINKQRSLRLRSVRVTELLKAAETLFTAAHLHPVSNFKPCSTFQTDAFYPEGCYHGNTRKRGGGGDSMTTDSHLTPPPLLFAPGFRCLLIINKQLRLQCRITGRYLIWAEVEIQDAAESVSQPGRRRMIENERCIFLIFL